ncbi:MAG: hypothetical protein E7324_03045 [Clostridiales bacterium]|nr:hypothetical protein [Clostridiales bacterium]
MENRKEVLFKDLAELCEPKENISPVRELGKWNAVPYETRDIKGSMLVSLQEGHPGDVFLAPELTGWYKILVGQYRYSHLFSLKLTDDRGFTYIAPDGDAAYASHSISEVYWKAADMTGQTVTIRKHSKCMPQNAAIAWFRFVPMTDEEVAAFKADQARKDTKRLYATHDMHGQLAIGTPQSFDDWSVIVQNYEQSDVEWFSMENIFIFDGDPSTGDADNFAYPRVCDNIIQHAIRTSYTPEALEKLCRYGQDMGLKMCSSMRMGAWGIEFPYDQMYFVNKFMEQNKEKFRCIDRDGTPIDALSYIYPEVRSYVIGQFVSMARLGFDAVEMIYSRGVPYVLFEQPFVDRFIARYGEDPRPLALDDPRVTELRCEVLTEFVGELRSALDEAVPERRVGLHARCHFSLYDSRHVAVDVEEWAKRGYITAIISYPQRIREVLEGDLWTDESRTHLDLAKYYDYVRGDMSCIRHPGDVDFVEPWPDSRGVPQGPRSQKERIDEFMAIEKKYGVTVYIDIMPRQMPTAEYKRRALELYDLGAEHLAFWDAYIRVPNRAQWSMVRRLGHKDELPDFTDGAGEYFSNYRLMHIADKDVSRYIPAWGG